MSIKSLAAAFAAATVLTAAPSAAQVPQAAMQAAIDEREAQIYLTRDVPFPAQWIGNTSRFVYRKSVPGGFSFVMMDATTGEKQPAFDQERLAAALGQATGASYTALRLPFASAEFGKEGREITVRIGERAFVCDLDAYRCGPNRPTRRPRGFGVVRDLSVPADNSPKRSPDGRWEAYVTNFNIAVRPVGGKDTILSTDGSDGNFFDSESISWSPDSKKVAAYRVRPGFPRIVYKVDSTPEGQLQPKLTTQLYPKPGDAVDIDRPVIFNVEAGRQIDIPTALFDNPYSMSRLSWSKDGALNFEFDQRGHQIYRRIAVDPDTGAARVQAEEAARTFVNSYVAERRYSHDVQGLGRELIWASERDGWNHLYLYDGRTGQVKNQITKGNWLVREVLKVDDAKRQIHFVASGMKPNEDPYFKYVYRIDFDGSNLTPLTTASATHDVVFSSDLAYYVDTYSRLDQAPVAELHRTSDGALVSMVEKGDISKLIQAGYRPPEPFVAKGRDGKTDIYGIIIKPRNFSPSKRYPVVEYIYAGPHDSFVPKTFWPFGNSHFGSISGMQTLADMGFIVVQIDGMGTMNRSKAFHDVAWKNLGDSGFPDRILWHKAAAAKYRWYDASRVGIYGASAGGQSTLGALLFHPEFYKAGISFNGCYDNRMDKIAWNEAWMGWPVDENYSRSSGVDNAWRLQGRLKLVIGELDTNVDPSSSYQVVDHLVKAHKDFEMLVVPGESHAALRNGGIDDVYGQRLVLDFFLRNLGGQTTPNWNATAHRGGAKPAAITE